MRSSSSSVRARSRKTLAPAHTVTTGCRARASRSALTSPVSEAPRCTPPMPPVANTATPPRCASATDADTVVAPTGHPCATATARSRSAALRAGPRIRSCSSGARPSRATPSSTAVTAGTAPPRRTAARQRSSASALAGLGRPRLEKIVDSSATTGSAGGQRRRDLGVDGHRQHQRSAPGRGSRPADRAPRRPARGPRRRLRPGRHRRGARRGTPRRRRRPPRWCR